MFSLFLVLCFQHRSNDVARLKEEVEHSKRIIHELRSELHTITLRAQTTTESTDRLDAKVVQVTKRRHRSWVVLEHTV